MYTEVTILEDISILVANIRGLSILDDCILKILKIKKMINRRTWVHVGLWVGHRQRKNSFCLCSEFWGISVSLLEDEDRSMCSVITDISSSVDNNSKSFYHWFYPDFQDFTKQGV